jgi:hypothetical protein
MKSETKGIAAPRGRPAFALTAKQEHNLTEIRGQCPTRARPFEQAYSGRRKRRTRKGVTYCRTPIL